MLWASHCGSQHSSSLDLCSHLFSCLLIGWQYSAVVKLLRVFCLWSEPDWKIVCGPVASLSLYVTILCSCSAIGYIPHCLWLSVINCAYKCTKLISTFQQCYPISTGCVLFVSSLSFQMKHCSITYVLYHHSLIKFIVLVKKSTDRNDIWLGF